MNKKPQSKRELVRVPYEQNVLINGALRVQAIDLSEGGLYLHTGRSFPSNSVVEVSFPLFHETLSVQAVVRFSHEGVGMGLMFKALNDQQKALVRRYIT
ncbi:hypothetical protein GWN63_02750, partial [Candidatus Bathyarchaeota archaeon]|nr:hypothetical protein [Desulfobacterales bacterium]NIU81148.1 hypothetical protein [Candidatus Bathyarchaeota archaeon]